MSRTTGLGAIAMLALLPIGPLDSRVSQDRPVRDLVSDLGAQDPGVRARAACALREHGSDAAAAIPALTTALADGAPVDQDTCNGGWWRGGDTDLTSPGELAAAALVAIGSRAFEPVLSSLGSPAWIARRNAAWALGALDDQRATPGLITALRDGEAGVRSQAAWALGAIDDNRAVEALIALLTDPDVRVRRQTAWALGAIDDNRAAAPLAGALGDADDRVRAQAAWALGAIDGRDGVPALARALKDPAPRVRQQAAWALGAIGDARALQDLLTALKDSDAHVRRQAAWAIGVIER